MIFKCGKKKKGVKRYLVLAAILAVAFMASPAFAFYESPNREVQTYICTNSSTTAYGATAIAVTTIVPEYCRILGYSIMPYDNTKGSEFVVGLYDDTDAQTATAIFDEAELGATNDKAPRFLPYPKRLTNGLTVWQGMNTVVIIYYEDTRKS